jgi:hypothetical protein
LSAHTPIEVFYSYSHEDSLLRDELEKHLKLLQRQGIITQWHDRHISPGSDWTQAISIHLERASVILLLISVSFLASDYCYSIEMQRALERHQNKEARVIPILLRPVDWKGTPFEQLQALPTNAKPITSWSNQDEAFADIASGLRQTIKDLSFNSKESLRPHSTESVRIVTVDITDLVNTLKMRKNNNQGMVLFLGSRAGGLFYSQSFYNIMKGYCSYSFKTLTHQEQFVECFKLLQQECFGDKDIHNILKQSLRERATTEANIYLAELVQQDLFDIIISTNVDTFLEDAFKEVGLKEEHHFDVIIPKPHPSLHNLIHSGKRLSCKVIKAFGDLGSRVYTVAKRDSYLDSIQELKGILEHILARETLVIGFDPVWDQEMARAFPAGEDSLWLVAEEDIRNKHPLALLGQQGRLVKRITGKTEQFVEALHWHFYERMPVSYQVVHDMYVELRSLRNKLDKLETIHSDIQKVHQELLHLQKEISVISPENDKENVTLTNNC